MKAKGTRVRTLDSSFVAVCLCVAVFGPLTLMTFAQQPMNMGAIENSVGYLASGTSIQPKTTSESTAMIHASIGNWTTMFHANAFLVDIQQNGARGRDKLFSTNWMMPMIHRQFGSQGISFRAMLSFEPATITQRRYPLLFQTGETAYGLSIIDGQHPHDFFMELAGRYDVRAGEGIHLFVYGGPVGEAALGPTPFPHRASASENPLAPIGHHQQDSTHIATNVISVGAARGPVQVEASTFHGREPDEGRWNIGRGKPDSFAARVTIAPYKTLSGQFSTGRINEPESTDPRLDTIRTTASMHYNKQLSSGHIASSFIWGRNKNLKDGSRRIFNSYNLEVTAKFFKHNWLWTRLETADRDQSLLPVAPQPAQPACMLCGLVGRGISSLDDSGKGIPFDHVVLGPDGTPMTIEEIPIGRVKNYTVGYERELPVGLKSLNFGVGVQATLYGLPPSLKAVYGNRPSTFAVFLRLRPSGNMQEHMKIMHR
jgi:hypothetical protein